MNIWTLIKNIFTKQEPTIVKELENIPKTLEEAVNQLIGNLDQKNKEVFMASADPGEFHFTAGMSLRNDWQLWEEETPLPTWFRENLGLGHADDMSTIILRAAWHKLKGTTYDLIGDVHQYREFWFKQGIDPKTQQRIA